MSGIEVLYKNFGILADAEEGEITKYASAYEGIIQATKGSAGEKKLAPGFITKFFRHFPSFHDTAIDAILDLIEEEDSQIRRLAIKSLPDICKGASDDSLYVRVSDVLTQLLPIEDPTDLGLVKTSMAAVLQMNTKLAMVGIFDQIMGEDETIREKGIEYICGPLMSMRHKLFLGHPENEQYLLELIKKVLVDVTGEEFETLMDLLSKLEYVSTAEGSQQLANLINEQAELSTEFKPDDAEFIDKFTTCFRQALKFSKCGSTASLFIKYLCVRILPAIDQVKEDQTRQELLQLLAEGCLYPIGKEIAAACIQFTYDYLLEHLPLPPEVGTEQPKLQFSIIECVLFAFHEMCQHSPEFLTADENSNRLKDLRLRLQYFARGSQAYNTQISTALKGKNALEMKDDQNKIRGVALKMTANINALIKDFFHNPPSFKTSIALSWGIKKQGVNERKRPCSDHQALPKRKPSPIRFESSTTQHSSKKEDLAVYSPPKNKFSKKFSNGSSFDDYQASRKSTRGGWRGKKTGQGSWRV